MSAEVTGPAGAGLAEATDVDATNALLTTIAGYLDGLETLIAATNTLLTATNGYVDGLEALIASTNTKLDSVITALGTANGHLANIKTNTDRIP